MSDKDNIVQFNGYTKLDINPDNVLEAAVGEVDRVLVLGWDKENEVYFASSFADEAEINWLLDRIKHTLQLLNDNDY